jgi:hypothetical protein
MPLLNADFRERALSEWVSALATMLADKQKHTHYSQQGQLRMQDFTHHKMFQKWLTVIEQVMSSR